MTDPTPATTADATTVDLAPGRLERLRAINAACERFEADWAGGARPRIEDVLGGVDPAEHPDWLAELLPLELELRRGGGESPAPGDYRGRFAGLAAVVDAALLGSTLPSGRKPPGPRGRPGPCFGEYELIVEIARGGMGVVYKARQRGLNRVVALKLMLSGRFASEAETARFLREAEMAAGLDHPNIVPIYEVGHEQGQPFIAMKLVDGQGLNHHVTRLCADPRASARLLACVARAVAAAHAGGLLHRDLKPANILLDARGEPHVTDFGLATRLGGDGPFTRTGAVVGTPSYMAPEQARGPRRGELAETADVYSLGAVLYELLTGRPPFRADSPVETLVQVLEREPAAPRQVRPGVPRALEQICLRCLEKAPDRRYPTAEALAADLDRYLRGEDVEAWLANPALRARRWARREPELAARLGALAVVVALTQYNYYYAATSRNPAMHNAVTALEVLWAAASLGFQWWLRRGRDVDTARLLWVGADVVSLTAIILLLRTHASSDVVGYPLLIAASGLWSRVRLVWWTAALCEVGYLVLLADVAIRGTLWAEDHHPNVVMASIAVTGAVVAHQVKRLWAISSFYDHRPAE